MVVKLYRDIVGREDTRIEDAGLLFNCQAVLNKHGCHSYTRRHIKRPADYAFSPSSHYNGLPILSNCSAIYVSVIAPQHHPLIS